MNKEKLKRLVDAEYLRLNIDSGRLTAVDASYMAPELLGVRSNQIIALINVMSALLNDEKGGDSSG